jgi:hypothetical protein
VAPYFWASGISGDVSVGDFVSVPIDAPFTDVIESFDFGVQAHFEGRKDRWGFGLDVSYVNLGVPVVGPLAGQLDVEVDVRQTTAEGVGFYRAAQGGRADNPAFLDVLAGARYTGTRVRLETRLGTSDDVRPDWVDALAGLRADLPLGSGEPARPLDVAASAQLTWTLEGDLGCGSASGSRSAWAGSTWTSTTRGTRGARPTRWPTTGRGSGSRTRGERHAHREDRMIEIAPRAGLAGALLFAAVAYAQEPPPPPVEAPPGPEFRMIEPRAEEVLRRMSELLARAPSFALEADEVFDEVPEQEPRRQLVGRRQLVLRRPDRLGARASGDALHRSVWYDGKTITALEERNVYASLEVGATIDAALDRAFERTGLAVPLADFLYADPTTAHRAPSAACTGIHEAAGGPATSRPRHRRSTGSCGSRPATRRWCAGDRLQDRGRGAAVLGDDSQVDARRPGAGRALPLRAARDGDPRGAARVPARGGQAMMRRVSADLCLLLAVLVGAPALGAEKPRGGGGSVYQGSRGGNVNRSGGGNATWQGPGGRASGSRSVTKSGDDYQINKQVRRSGASRTTTRDVDVDDGQVESVERSSTATGRRAIERSRTVETRAATRRSKARPARAEAARPPGRPSRDGTGTASPRSPARSTRSTTATTRAPRSRTRTAAGRWRE